MSNAAAVKVAEIHGRGRSLIASRPIRAGELILSDSPLLLYAAAPASSSSSSSSCSRCFRTILSDPLPCSSCSGAALFCSPRCLSSSSHSHPPWACQTLSRLRSLSLDPDLLTQAHFLIAAYSLPAPDFHRLLSLHGSDAPDPSAAALHSLLSPPPPLPASHFSPALTSALLAKDRMNAFGLMEPFRQDDPAHRTVRAYGIYPNASFFNHDCLPNACRFDYVDAAGDGNTQIAVRAIHDIPEGREVCISYFPVNWSYPERQRRLLEDYGFHCVCDRCEVEKNWKDDEDDDEGMETVGGEDEEVMEGDSDADFPHAYFFIRYVCEREDCGGTLAPIPPPPQGPPSHIMECNVCGLLKKDEDDDGEDGEMLDQ